MEVRLEREIAFHDHSFANDIRAGANKFYAISENSRVRSRISKISPLKSWAWVVVIQLKK